MTCVFRNRKDASFWRLIHYVFVILERVRCDGDLRNLKKKNRQNEEICKLGYGASSFILNQLDEVQLF